MEGEIRRMRSNLLPYSTNTRLPSNSLPGSSKYAICGRIYCLIARCARIYCLGSLNTRLCSNLLPYSTNTRLPSNSLPGSSKYAICGRIYCLTARNTAAALEFTALKARIRGCARIYCLGSPNTRLRSNLLPW